MLWLRLSTNIVSQTGYAFGYFANPVKQSLTFIIKWIQIHGRSE